MRRMIVYWVCMVGRVGNRFVWQGGQTENQGGQTEKNFGASRRIFAHPGLKPCRRPGPAMPVATAIWWLPFQY